MGAAANWNYEKDEFYIGPLTTPKDPGTRRAALAVLVKLLRDPQPARVEAAARILAAYGEVAKSDPHIVPALHQALSHTHGQVQRAVMAALEALGQPVDPGPG
jgi:hypothetical protein